MRLWLAILAMMLTPNCFGKASTAPAATGRMRLTFTEKSPHSDIENVFRRMNKGDLRGIEKLTHKDYDLASQPLDVFVPPNYRSDVPHGLFVWVGITDASPAWEQVFAREKLIFVSARPANDPIDLIAIRLPLDAVHNLKKQYNIDDERVYVAGFSAGGDIATIALQAFPDVFRGGYFMMGGSFYASWSGEDEKLESISRPNGQWQAPIDEIKKNMRLVLMRGERDTSRANKKIKEGRDEYDALILDGFTRVSFIEVPRLGHALPDATWFEKGIVALDKFAPTKPPTTGPTTQSHPLPSQIAQAKRILNSARFCLEFDVPILHADREAKTKEARQYLRQVLDDYPTTPAAKGAREMLLKLDQPSSRPSRPK